MNEENQNPQTNNDAEESMSVLRAVLLVLGSIIFVACTNN